MRKLTSGAAFAALLAVGFAPATADAAVYVTTWTGTILTGFDQTGVFGPDHTDLANKAFTAVFTFDDTIAGATTFDNSFVSEVFGGRTGNVAHGNSSPLNGSLTINGVTHVFGSAGGSFLNIRDGYPNVNNGNDNFHEEVHSDFTDPGGQGNLTLDAFSNHSSFLSGHDYRTPVDYTGDGLSGNFAITESPRGPSGGSVANGTFKSNGHFTVALQSAAVPEPTSWSLMIAGFGLAGAMLRRRRLAPA